ncbi:MAG: magnesium and cobalt transport protein CorA [Nitrospirae bacterium]|nr:MAG: magnesium and cobalt transport protein CorA [Nitrospirota bacterium]
MISCFAVRDGYLQQVPWDEEKAREEVIWIDLVAPTRKEWDRIEQMYGAHLPALTQLEDLEATARFFVDRDGIHIHSYFLDEIRFDGQEDEDASRPPRLITVAFALQGQRLYTVRQQELSAFRIYRLRARREFGLNATATQVAVGLFETKVDLLADALEYMYAALDATSQQVFAAPEHDMKAVLKTMTQFEDVNGKIRMVLLDTQRAFSFLQRHVEFDQAYRQKIKEGFKDIESLIPHTGYFFEKINFLMDTATGMINVEQNRIIKVMTLASVVFLPPTLIASIYGMNFSYMPELTVWWGYPLALSAMVVSALAPYWFFKHRGWL